MTRALQHAQIDVPRADRVSILVCHYAGQLMQVGEVVNGPGGQKFRQPHYSERGMRSAASQIFLLYIQCLQGS